ncbi:MAG: hypothetical protein U5R06_15915 [candidate division KSB1 bacterium]|nr:hypothetical protein [candidate division KSB1 bacterium]
MKIRITKYFATVILLIVLLFTQVYGAGFNYKELTRSKLWARIWNTSAVGQPTLSGEEYYKFDYPGHVLGANLNDHYGMCEHSGWMAWANVDGAGTPFRVTMTYDPNPTYISPMEDSQLITNHNMQDPSVKAEEMVTGSCLIVEYGVEMHFKAMSWSYPKYDDFIIYEYTLKNTGDHDITNFRFSPTAEINIANPIAGGWRDDDQYEWSIEHEAFYFHDDVLWDTEGNPVTQTYGLTQSDKAEPADIFAPASINHEFRAPQYFTYYWLDKPEKSDPTERDHMNIVDKNNLNQESNRVQPDPMNDNPEVDFDPDSYILASLEYDQPLPPTAEDGTPLDAEAARLGLDIAERTRYEREIDYLYTTGPYDLPPGEELKFVMVVACGMMDFERVAEGGVENEAHLPDGADSLWKHIAAAQELYSRDYECPDPPPTPTNGMNTLVLTPQPLGMKVQWPQVPDTYVDPDFNVNDLAGYRVYRSSFRNVGPWQLVEDIPLADVEIEDGLVTFNDDGLQLGVGYYYGVTTYDTGHDEPWPHDPTMTEVPSLESGLVNANSDPVYPQTDPSDNMDDIRVYPNPFIQHSQLTGEGEGNRIEFVNVPSICTIRIYTLAGEHIRTIEHDDGSGDEPWGSRVLGDYQVNKYLQFVAPGPYLFHVESHVPGHEGEEKIGKFVIIK